MNESNATILDVVDTETQEALAHMVNDVQDQNHETREGLRLLGSVGPYAPQRINDLLASDNASRENLTQPDFIQGIRRLVEFEFSAEETMVTLGAFYTRAREIGKKSDDDFSAILLSLYHDPLPAEYQEPDRDANGQTIPDATNLTGCKMRTVKHTHIQRLAHAVYMERQPLLVTTASGTSTLATKRIDNAIAAYKSAKALVQSTEQSILDTRTEQEKLLLPSPMDTQRGRDDAAKIKKAEEDTKASAKAARAMLPRTPATLYGRMYRACGNMSDDPNKVSEYRQLVIDLFAEIGFSLEDRIKWHAEFMKGIKPTT